MKTSRLVVTSTARCPVCGEAVCDDDAVTCFVCDVVHHPDCWRYMRGCAIYGCRGGADRGPRLWQLLSTEGRPLEAEPPVARFSPMAALEVVLAAPFRLAWTLFSFLGTKGLLFVAAPLLVAAMTLLAIAAYWFV